MKLKKKERNEQIQDNSFNSLISELISFILQQINFS